MIAADRKFRFGSQAMFTTLSFLRTKESVNAKQKYLQIGLGTNRQIADSRGRFLKSQLTFSSIKKL